MKREEFKDWLLKRYKGKTGVVNSRVANVGRVNEIYDVDNYYARDLEDELIELFTYSKADARAGLEPGATIEINGDYYTGIATLKQAIKLYFEFLDQENLIRKGAVDALQGPIFKGSYKNFIDYVGPRCKNIVNRISAKERKDHKGKCEYCGGIKELQSAHLEGEERPVIILNILENYYKKGNELYEVPLVEFEMKFKDAHYPIRNHFFFLCEECHNKYDKAKTITTSMLRNKIGI